MTLIFSIDRPAARKITSTPFWKFLPKAPSVPPIHAASVSIAAPQMMVPSA